MIDLKYTSTAKDGVRISIGPEDSFKENVLWDYNKGVQWDIFVSPKLFKESLEKQRITGSEIYRLVQHETTTLIMDIKEDLFALIEGILLADYRFDRFLSKKKTPKLTTIQVPKTVSKSAIAQLTTTNTAVSWVRDMVNLPVSHLNAVDFAKEIKALCEAKHCSVDILNHTKIKAMKMGGLLAVNKGSVTPPTFTVIHYKPSKRTNKKPIVLVGKGVVYDTGGLSLKPTPGSMDSMKSDMAGAAMVAGAIYMLSELSVPVEVIGLIPATDNRPGGEAYAPGDIIKMFNGSTVEVLNTDAEGRMILADALSYADKFNPELVLSAATLTGAALRAIGTSASIAMGNADPSALEQLQTSGFETHERVVTFPFWDDYLEPMKSEIADLKNIGGPDAGMITAGKFLETFVKAPYIHLDVAGPTWLEAPKHYRPKGGTGYGVRLLFDFIINYPKWTKNKTTK